MSRFPTVSAFANLLLAGGILLTSCKSGASDAAAAIGSELSMEPMLEAPSDDQSVGQHLVQKLIDSRVVGGLRFVDLTLENQGTTEVAFAYQPEWLDHLGEPVVDSEALWIPLVLVPLEKAAIALKAPHPRAESWRLVVVALSPAE